MVGVAKREKVHLWLIVTAVGIWAAIVVQRGNAAALWKVQEVSKVEYVFPFAPVITAPRLSTWRSDSNGTMGEKVLSGIGDSRNT